MCMGIMNSLSSLKWWVLWINLATITISVKLNCMIFVVTMLIVNSGVVYRGNLTTVKTKPSFSVILCLTSSHSAMVNEANDPQLSPHWCSNTLPKLTNIINTLFFIQIKTNSNAHSDCLFLSLLISVEEVRRKLSLSLSRKQSS